MAKQVLTRLLARAIPDLNASRFLLRVEVTLPGVAGDSPAFKDPVELFVAAANAGLLGGQRFPPEQSAAVVTAWSSAEGAAVEIDCRAVDGGAVRVLANLLRRSLGGPGASLHAIVVSGPDGQATSPAVRVDVLPYPQAQAQLPFEVDIQAPERTLDPVNIRLTFDGALTDAQFDAVGNWLRFWIAMVGNGAYLEPNAELADLPDVDQAEIYLLSPAQVEAVAYGFAADDAAFDGLIGLLTRASLASGSRLTLMEVW